MKKNFCICEEDLEEFKKSDFKITILTKYNLLKKIYFKKLDEKINYIKKNKFNKYIDYKDLIYEYNEQIKHYNEYIYNFKYISLTLENLHNDLYIKTFQTEIYPFSVMDFFYNFEKSKKKKFLNNKETINYDIKGLICFLNYKQTKIKEEIKLYVLCDENHKEDELYAVDILDFIKHKDLTLFTNINKIVKFYLKKQWEKYLTYCEENYSKETASSKEENLMSKVNTGILCTLSIDETNFSKKEILECFYCDDNNQEVKMHLHLYFVLYQYTKKTNKFNVQKINKNISTILHNNEINNISYDLTKTDPENFNFSIGLLKDEERNVCFLNYNNINSFEIDSKLSLEKQYKFLKDNNFINISDDNKIILNINDFTIKTELSDILYSNFLNIRKKINYNKIYFTKDNIYIPDILIKCKKEISKNVIYKNIKKKFFIKKNDIKIKKDLNSFLEKLFYINNNDIDWLEFVKSNKEVNIDDINLKNLFSWFKQTYEKHIYQNKTNSLCIKNFFTSTNLDIIFFKTILKDIETSKSFVGTEEFNILKNFLKFFEKHYYIENNYVFLKNKNKTINEEENFDFLFFVEIMKIIFFLN